MMGNGFLGMWIWPILLIVIIVAGAVLIRGFGRGCCSAGHPMDKHADEILRERYARGEISREEFERIKTDLDVNRR